MLRRFMFAGPRLSPGVVRLAICLCALLYVLVFAKAGAILPEFVFRDADKIQAQMSGSSTYDGSSFDAVGRFYALFGPILLNVLVATTGVLFIRRMLLGANSPGGIAVAVLLAAPCIFFNLFVASKDTLVVMMSMLIVSAARSRRPWPGVVVALLLYTLYALLVRRYFMLIAVAGCGAWAFRTASLRWKTVLAAGCLAGLFLLPDAAYEALLHPRDMAVDYLVYQSPFGARTSFYNPMPPDSFVAFCVDYLYAAVRLNFPFAFLPGVKEFALQLFVFVAVWPALRKSPVPASNASRRAYRQRETFACLLLGHVGVSILFEPDLGSYIRHLSSVALFSVLLLPERTDVRRQRTFDVRGRLP